MMKHVTRRVFFLIALYLCIIFGIFFLQFTKGGAFSLSLGSMLVSGSRAVDSDGAERPELPLHIGTNGIDVFFDSEHSLTAWTGEKTSVALDVTGFSERDSGFAVTFEGGVALYFRADRRGDSEVLEISSTIPRNYLRVSVPYKIARSARLEKKDSLTLVATGKSRFSFSQPQSFSSGALQRLDISRAAPTVYYQTWRPAKGLVIADLASMAGASDRAFQAATERFAAAALASFREAINGGTYNEALVADYVAEMGRVGMYRSALEAIPADWSAGAARTWRSSPFLDHLEKTWAPFTAEERNERSRLARLLSERDPAFFEFPSVIPYLVDRGSSVLLDDVAKMVAGVDMDSVTAVQAAGILEAILDAPSSAPSIAATLSPLAEACERKLKASLWRVQDFLYLSDDGNAVDAGATFRVASVLRRYGSSASGDAGWKSAGNLLVTTLLDFAQDRAELPSRFTLSGTAEEKTGVVAKPDRILAPSEVYPLVMSWNPWLPHAVSFASMGESGLWAWTSSGSVSVSRPETGALKIVTRFAQGETHYMVIRGVKPFYRIQIYGMDFRTDPRFESYNSSGYRYNEENETLYLKMRHKSEYEDITIWFGAPTATPATPVAPEEGGATVEGAAAPAGSPPAVPAASAAVSPASAPTVR